jgi:hypothetical protein
LDCLIRGQLSGTNLPFFVPQLQQDLTSARQHIQELERLLQSQNATDGVETGVDANEAGAADVAVRKLEEGLSGGETQIWTNAVHALKASSIHHAPPESVAPDVAPAVVQGTVVKMGTPQAPQKFVDAFPLVSGDDEAAFVQGAVVKAAVSPCGPDTRRLANQCANDLPKSPAVEESTLQLMHQQFSSLREELTKQLYQNQELQKRVDSLEYQVCTCGHTSILTEETGKHTVSNDYCTQALGPADC